MSAHPAPLGAPATEAGTGHVAVIDIGSNSIRLVVYDRLARAPLPRFNEKSLCGLGRDLDGDGRLAPEAVACALHALGRFARIAEGMGAAWLEVAATEAVRGAPDGATFLARAESRVGRRIRVLSGDDEARLSALGVAGGFWRPQGVVADLGGGSVEFARLGPAGPEGTLASLPIGALRLTPMLGKGRAAAVDTIDRALDTVPWLANAAAGGALYVVGGGWRALARIHLAATQAPLPIVHAYSLDAGEARKVGRDIAGMDQKRLAALPGVPRSRIETLPASALLFERTIRRLQPREVVFSALGLREGLLFAALGAERLREDPLLAGARDLGRERNRAAAIGAAATIWTAPLFPGESDEEARLRIAAAEVSDVGWLESPASRAREAFFLLLYHPFIGIGHAERVWLAYAVFIRYDGAPEDPVLRPLLALLSSSARERAEVLGLALQLAYRLSAGVPRLLAGTRLELTASELILRLDNDEAAPGGESVKPRLKALGRALGRERTRIVVEG